MRKKFNFLSSLFSRRDWFETRFVRNPEDRFSRVVACVACSTNISSATDNNIKNKFNEEPASDILTGITLFDCALHRLIHKSLGTAGALIFWLQLH